MSKVRIFILEDDVLQSSKLEMLLEQMNYVVAGVCDNGDEAVNQIIATKPDLLLADIDIFGNRNGIEVVSELNSKNPIPVIFTTSFKDKETIDRAKQTEPFAYLIKPFEKESLQAAIEIAMIRFQKPKPNSVNEDFSQADQLINDAIYLKSEGMLTKVDVNDISYVEVQDKHCLIGLPEKIISVRMTMGNIEEKLKNWSFMRVHRSFLVNIKKVANIALSESIIYLGQYKVPLSRSYKEHFLEAIEHK